MRGGVWTPPYRLDISEWLHKGENQISVEVTTTWQNRLIGDSRLPEQERTTWTACNGWSEKDLLQKSGLIRTCHAGSCKKGSDSKWD